MKNISELNGYTEFHNQGRILLESFLSSFINCHVNIQEHAISHFESGMGLDITSNALKNCYEWDDKEDEVIIVPKIFDRSSDEVIAMLPIRLSGPQMHLFPKNYLEKIVKVISIHLADCAERKFTNSLTLFGPEFERKMVAHCLSTGKNTNQIMYLVDVITRLSRTTFESNDFSTAFILTPSEWDYAKENRSGSVVHLSAEHDLLKSPTIDKRFWYLSDGITSFYLINPSFKIHNMYIYGDNAERFIDSYSLRNTLRGKDILFRVTGLNQISIINSDGIEICNTENKWKFRDYGLICKIIKEHSGIEHSIVDSIMSNIIYCCQNKVSSIIWLPADCSQFEIERLLAKKYCAFERPISICDPDKTLLIKRILSSDGVTVIGNSGQIISHGAIVNLSKVTAKGQVGTGESAAKLLAQNGVSIKISQDGNIKMFYDNGKRCFVF